MKVNHVIAACKVLDLDLPYNILTHSVRANVHQHFFLIKD